MSFIASWWGKQDLNLQGHSPLVSKTSVSTIPPFPQKLVRNQRFELWTYRVSDGCSNQTELIPHKIGCPGKIRTSEMHESKSCALPLGYRAIMVEMRGFEPLSKNNTILEISFLPYKFWVFRSILPLYFNTIPQEKALIIKVGHHKRSIKENLKCGNPCWLIPSTLFLVAYWY